MKIDFSKDLDDFPESEKYLYWEYLKNYRDWKNILVTAEKEGREEGREEGKRIAVLRIAGKMKADNFDRAMIADITGLSPEEIDAL